MLVLSLFAILVLLSIADTATRYTLYRRLKERHPAKYDALDRPSIFIGRFTSAWAMLGFLVYRDHTLLKDSRTTRLSDALLALRVAILVAFVALMVLGAHAQRTG